ncbi:hypothetical protein M422DRAFT_61152 [Sphaerobolus stellatus SS14]|uniref:2-isopropylmalate synthase n=1 Tax=Sphaerobolus stellatus (strain SS14) TaxID=990650 RepID=A0A0C9U180_SPHS4|nr:hypothetical protein M422DRAFT_61152 [Sphaerobolus stellatus SS14]
MPMLQTPSDKYESYLSVPFPERVWPTKRVTSAPQWLSTDLRDGNQALANPMSNEQKLQFFKMLLNIGFKEIEVAYPAASDTEYQFCRTLIEGNHIPDGVAVQVISPMIPALLKRSIMALAGAKHAIIHLYAATSPLFRRVVFRSSKEETIQRAVTAAKMMRELTDQIQREQGTIYQLNYCPETFSQTEMDFAVEICEAVKAAWGKSGSGPREKIIFNMSATVEVGPPNHYADQVEYFSTHITNREHCILSAHPHNDRGCGVAATELALVAGADRVEGCLLGQGERTGNVDIITLALNMYSQGVSPELDFSDLPSVREMVVKSTGIPCPDRYPYAGKLVFAAFAGTHQDAIKKGLDEREKKIKNGEKGVWAIPYLPIDPADVGCSYDAVIRVNSQSGRAGAAYFIKKELSLDLPRSLQTHFGKVIQRESDKTGKELTSKFVVDCFKRTYHLGSSKELTSRLLLSTFRISTVSPSSSDSASGSDDTETPHNLKKLDTSTVAGIDAEDTQVVRFEGDILVDNETRKISGIGSSPISALLEALSNVLSINVKVISLSSHTLSEDSKTASYIELSNPSNKPQTFFGVGVSSNSVASRLRAIISGINASLPVGFIFSAQCRPIPSLPSRPNLILRAGTPTQGIDPGEWRRGVETST